MTESDRRHFKQSKAHKSVFANDFETSSFHKDFSKQSSIYSIDRFDSSSNLTIESRLKNVSGNLFSADFIQSSPNFIYPNVRMKSTGYKPEKEHFVYVFENKLFSTKKLPLIYLDESIGSEYFLRKSIDFERLKYPLSSIEYLEPLIDLIQIRRQFLQEIPHLDDLSDYRFLPETVSGLFFLSSTRRHLCSEFNQNKFLLDNLVNMSQRENLIIQTNALNDKRYRNLLEQLNDICSSNILEKNSSKQKITF